MKENKVAYSSETGTIWTSNTQQNIVFHDIDMSNQLSEEYFYVFLFWNSNERAEGEGLL